MTTQEIETLVKWSEPKRVQTKSGPRDLRTAQPVNGFWDAWRSQKDELRDAGVSCSKNGSGEWEACWWLPIPESEKQELKETIEASRATSADLEIPAPDELNYLPFQRAGIAFAASRPSCLIADEMGLGKTIQALGAINLDLAIKSVLVVCLRLNWKREAEKWLVTSRTIEIATAKSLPEAEIVIVNYDILSKLSKSLAERSFDLLIADECHYAKNPKSQRSKALYQIKATRKIFLTGTPIVNRPVELHPIIAALDPETWNRDGKGFFPFAKRYCNARHNGYGWDFSGAANLSELQERLRSTIMVRRLKADVLTELPAKRRQVIELAPNGAAGKVTAEQEAFAAREELLIQLRARVELAKASEKPEDHAEAVAALKEGAKALFAEIAKLRHATALAKVPAVVEHVRSATSEGEHKVVVFCHHHDVEDALIAEFGSSAVLHRGGLSDEEKQSAVDRFQTDPSVQIFVGSIQASGVGITLTAAAHMIFAELDWVPGNVTQAEDRCHRIGQVSSVLVQHLVLEGSLDATMARTLIKKQEVIDQALDRDIPERAEPVIPTRQRTATESTSRAKLDKIAKTLTAEDCEQIHTKLKFLAARCDFAQALDGAGFNKYDAPIGHSLAEAPCLTFRQAALGQKLVNKYRKQFQSSEL